MITQTVTDDAGSGLKKAEVTLTLPVLPLTVFGENENILKFNIKDEYIAHITRILKKQLEI